MATADWPVIYIAFSSPRTYRVNRLDFLYPFKLNPLQAVIKEHNILD
jgi:hypothetical protein